MPSVLFLCAIPVEWQAIVARLDQTREIFDKSDFYLEGSLVIDGVRWAANVAQVGVGNLASALESQTAIERFNPEIAIFVGIAGGVKDVALGDVVFASQVHPYESGKDVRNGLLPRPRSMDLPHLTQQISKSIARLDEGSYRTFSGAIAAGEKVVASARSATGSQLREAYGDTLAVEMEGAGFMAALRRCEVDHAIVRGISDLLDSKSASDDEGWQQIAAQNAMGSALTFLGKYAQAKGLRNAVITVSDLSADEMSLGTVAASIPTPNPSQNYVLLALPGSKVANDFLTSGLPFSLVLDFDRLTDQTGAYALSHENIATRRNVKLATPEDLPNYSISSTTWLAVQGLEGRGQAVESTREWIARERRALTKHLESYSAVVGGRHTTLIVPTDSPAALLRLVLDDLISAVGARLSIIVVGPTVPDELSEVADVAISRDLDRLAEKLDLWFGLPDTAEVRMQLPGLEGPLDVSPNDSAWVSEDLDPLWIHNPGSVDLETLDFYRGGTIGWSALRNGVDIARTIQPEIDGHIRSGLERRRARRVNLFHEPGAGGTTVARRALFNFHEEFPCVEVRFIRPLDTARRIDWLARATNLPVLVVVDSAEFSDQSVGDLVSELRSMSTATLVLHVSRRFGRPSNLSESSFLDSRLDDLEADDFFEQYSNESPDSTDALEELRHSADQRRNPFFFALTAFESNFAGIERYVASRLSDLPTSQSDVLLMCSLAHYYGQQGVPEYQLASLLGLPTSRAGALRTVLDPGARSLLWRSQDGAWRTVHQLVALEVLKQSGGGDGDAWKRKITDWGRQFADFCSSLGVQSVELLELVRTVFVNRGGLDLIGTEVSGRDMFSRLVEDVPSNEGAVDLLAYVSMAFPDEAHLAAHVARFYAFRLGNYDKAIDYSRRAIRAEPRASALRHVAGMVYRAQAYSAIGAREPIEAVADFGRLASEYFAASRELSYGQNEHGFISDAQLRIRVIDYATREAGTISKYLRGATNPYVIECIAEAESLLSQVRDGRDYRSPSGYESRSRSELARLYGDYNDALQMLDALLARDDGNKAPVRRQLAWTYLARAERQWQNLSQKSLSRIVSLLQENLSEQHSSAADTRMWWRAVRYLETPPSQDRVLELLAYWREAGRTRDSLYCTYVAYALEVLDGMKTAMPQMLKYKDECSSISVGIPTRTWSFEWVGTGVGIAQLVHQSELGDWDPDTDFWTNSDRLRRVEGRVSRINGPQSGTAEVAGMSAFFVPARAGIERARDENALVTGYLGFSYDGPRLWEVERLDRR